ncbi:MAG: ribosome recycling factor [Bacteroidales bacterium]|jgi:ribosome recycling factor|nr:ribosome recycling factor [Bacteroidales bacterium]
MKTEADAKDCLSRQKASLDGAIAHLDRELAKIRAGKASPSMLAGVKVDYYGNPTPLEQISAINTPDAKQIIVQPWEKNMLSAIEKALLAANLGFTPQNTGEIIRISLPPLTEERRKDLVKMCKTETENSKVVIRNTRRDANEEIKKMTKDGLSEDLGKKAEKDIQDQTDNYIKKADSILAVKEKEIMTV